MRGIVAIPLNALPANSAVSRFVAQLGVPVQRHGFLSRFNKGAGLVWCRGNGILLALEFSKVSVLLVHAGNWGCQEDQESGFPHYVVRGSSLFHQSRCRGIRLILS